MSIRRVAVTGIGLMTSLGSTRDTVWQSLVEGRSGIGTVTRFDASGYRSSRVAEIGAYERDAMFSRKDWRRLSRSDQIAVIATREALADAGIDDGTLNRTRVGISLGTGTGNMVQNEEWF